jgi:hypothetical protein
MKKDGSGSGSISQRHVSADPDPDPHQNVMDPQHCKNFKIEFLLMLRWTPAADPLGILRPGQPPESADR